jgi:hypothetical protein
MIAKITFLAAFMLFSAAVFAQTTKKTTEDARTGIRITTESTPLEVEPVRLATRSELETRIANIERDLVSMRQNTTLVANGSVAKLEAALRDKQSQLAALPRQ